MARTKPYTRETEFAAMVREHQAGLWRYLRFLGCEAALAEDLVQETFLAVWRKPFEDRGPQATAGYLRRVAHNLFVSAVRRAKVRPAFRDLAEADRAWAGHAGEDEGDAYRAALRLCLDTLGGKARRALELFYGERGSRKEVGAELGLKPDGVKTLMRRARDALRECIGRRMRA
jgi:RNA polymerase sigma-70 factor (ECF subfamily)